MKDWSGTVVADRYHVQALLGAGGMGDVYLAHDTRSVAWPEVVLKWLRPGSKHLDQETLEHFFAREVAAMRDLAHPNMVRLIDAIRHDGNMFLVMERLHGRTLEARLDAEGPMAWRAAFRLLLPIADVLAALHDAHGDIVHRDVKPANIFLAAGSGALTPKLLDFGIARLSTDNHTTRPVGSLSYLPPEGLAAGRPDQRYDVWSFGVVLYTMIAGEAPFDRADAPATIQAIATARAAPLEDVPPDVDEFVRTRLLAKVPSSRPTRHEVAQWMTQRLQPTRPTRTTRALVTQLVVVAFAAVAGFAGGALTMRPLTNPPDGVPPTVADVELGITEVDDLPSGVEAADAPLVDNPDEVPSNDRPKPKPKPKPDVPRTRRSPPTTLATVQFFAADAEGQRSGDVIEFELDAAGPASGVYTTPVAVSDVPDDGTRVQVGRLSASLGALLNGPGPHRLCLREPLGDDDGQVLPCR